MAFLRKPESNYECTLDEGVLDLHPRTEGFCRFSYWIVEVGVEP
jgi:hypothetical protein